ncbi:MAG: hypothetical protein AAF721_13780 [Myxococcota bacterium]
MELKIRSSQLGAVLVTLGTVYATSGCGTKASDAGTPPQASAPAAETQPASVEPSPAAAAPEPASAAANTLERPAGRDAPGNVPAVIAAALAVKDCRLVDGDLPDCPAADAFREKLASMGETKCGAEVRTRVQLLGSEHRAVRRVVLEYLVQDARECVATEEDPRTVDPLVAAALAEKEPQLRAAFVDELRDVAEDPKRVDLFPHFVEIAKTYAHEEGASDMLTGLARLLPDHKAVVQPALLDIAAKASDFETRVNALFELVDGGEKTTAVCDGFLAVSLVELDKAASDAVLTSQYDAIDQMLSSDMKCDRQIETWLAEFVPRAKRKHLPATWTDNAVSLVGRKEYAPKLVAIGKELQAVVPADAEIRPTVDELAEGAG